MLLPNTGVVVGDNSPCRYQSINCMRSAECSILTVYW